MRITTLLVTVAAAVDIRRKNHIDKNKGQIALETKNFVSAESCKDIDNCFTCSMKNGSGYFRRDYKCKWFKNIQGCHSEDGETDKNYPLETPGCPVCDVKSLVTPETPCYQELMKTGTTATCYQVAVSNLVFTAELPLCSYYNWNLAGFLTGKADTMLVVNDKDALMTTADLDNPPADHVIGFLRRFRAGEGASKAKSESDSGWVLFHVISSFSDEGTVKLAGANNGEKRVGDIQTIPTWSVIPSITVMMDVALGSSLKEWISRCPTQVLPIQDHT
jgi:hypothetical protein